ncbi:MAG: hypothetical protein V3R82_03855, partial [Candidatus Hydrothermarchaeales archaeon]
NIRNKVAHLPIDIANPRLNIKINDKDREVFLDDDFLGEFENYMEDIYQSLLTIIVQLGVAKNFDNEKLVLRG